MKYIALLRGINVGKSVKVNMRELQMLLEELGFTNVSTYLNSGNVFFESNLDKKEINEKIETKLQERYGSAINVLIKTKEDIIKIKNNIPDEWQNNDEQKTDIAYLFEEINSKEIIGQLPVKMEYLNIVYVDGALIINLRRENYNKSQLNKIISHKLYKKMTLRNVNTARKLAL